MLWGVALAAVCCCCFSIQRVSAQTGSGYYVISAPKVLRPNMQYHVSVTVHDVQRTVGILITIGGQSDAGRPIAVSQSVQLNPGENKVAAFTIDEWGTGKYTMKVIGAGGLQFTNETDLHYEHKSYLVFVQTDKGIYKPGQEVKIRVVVVNPNLMPSDARTLDMFITDGKGNRVKQWNRPFKSRGLFTAEMQLSEEPVLGDWNITVKLLDQVYQKTFTVAEYVLPNFDVTIDLPHFATFNNSDMVATIKAKYTYGKPVKGRVQVLVTPLVRSPQIRTYYQEPLRKVAELDGKVDIPFNLVSDLKLQDDYHRMIRFEAIVTEAVNERRQNATGVMGMFKYRETLELVKTSETFKPGLKYTVYVKVAYQDDIPVQDDVNPLVVKYGYTRDESIYDRFEFRIPKNGTVRLDIYPPLADNVHQLIIVAEYKDVHQFFPPIRKSESPSKNYLQAILQTENMRVGEEAFITINSTAPLQSFNVLVMGRGDILFADTVSAGGQKSIVVKFILTTPMAPRIRFVAYYIRPDGELVADGLSFQVEGVFQNFVNVAHSSDQVKPGETVNIQVTTRPNAQVGLLAVDQSVLLLKPGNDVTEKEILRQLDLFDPGRQTKDEFGLFYSSIWFPGSSTATQVFKEAGILTLTNGLLYDNDDEFSKQPEGDLRAGVKKGQPVGDYFIPKESEKGFRDPLDGSVILTTRLQFLETWLWADVTSGGDGKAVITREAPDTITSWVITAFSLDDLAGLAVTPSATTVTVFRPFFISLNLPYSVVRGEAIAIQVVVFNYMKQTLSATITLDDSGTFDFVTVEDEANQIQNVNLKTKRALVTSLAGSGEPTSVYFMIMPKDLGYIDIKVTANTEGAGDAVLKKLLVKPEGVPQRFNKAILIDLRSSSRFTGNATVQIPKNAVEGSERIEVSAIADVMGPSLSNFDSLLEMPFGCGEQNMVRFVPNIVVLQYLTSSSQLTDSIRATATSNMETGYQRQLTYKHDDGSFSAFGDRDPSGSTWLTAFVVKSLALGKFYITIDEKVINDSLTWLAAQQSENGSFPEVGAVSNKEIQGGAGKGVALTAYVLIAFVQSGGGRYFQNVMSKAQQLLEQEVEAMSDTYTIAITAFALHVVNSPMKDMSLRKLESFVTSTDDTRYWRKATDSDTPATLSQIRSVDIELTSYALMTYVLRGDIPSALQVVKWLVSQRNSQGGFLSTQDTVIAIEALAKLAERIIDPSVAMEVEFTFLDDQKKKFSLDRQNAAILQTATLVGPVKLVNISASGRGFAVVQVSYEYNVAVSKEFPAFQVNPFVDRSSDKNRLQLNVCAAYGEKGSSSNMAVMEVTLPSGYVIDKDSIPALNHVDRVKRVDIKDKDTGVIIYFDKLDDKLVCPTIKGYRTFRVAKQKPTSVYLYDYYDQGKAARYFYQAPAASLCDICEGDECNTDTCRKQQEQDKLASTLDTEPNNSCQRAPLLPSMLLACAAILALCKS